MVAWADRFDLEKQIFISALCMFASLEAFAEPPSFASWLPYGQYVLLNPSCVLAGVYMVWYIQLDRVAGSLGAILVFMSYLFANFFVQDYAG
ncbi:hypothetical protein PF008_g27987 [Phytophthora fragariae]|uniref:Uncharacterized protein n=1 Tax=Phytophthora fragariae TaxID=53985 RepID=A0A6G0QCL1_9STRA|nr:hypothetical protein PF008_g27987 [Phytophthora fragariae]